MTLDELIATLPPSLEAEFVATAPDEPIRLAVGTFDVFREGRLLGRLDGELALEWTPKLRICCTGDSDAAFAALFDDRPVELRFPPLGLTVNALVTSVKLSQRCELRALLMKAENTALEESNRFRFYLANFPFVLGEPVRTGNGQVAGVSRDRLTLKAGDLVCTIDAIYQTRKAQTSEQKPGYVLTHVAEVKRSGPAMVRREIDEVLDALYWLLAFLRGARTGPVLPSVDSPFAKTWLSLAPWIVDEPRTVESWVPTHAPVDFDGLFEGFLQKWRNPQWNEGLRTTLAWYIAANAPSTPNEARITLCQIALEVLASLRGFEQGAAHERIRALLKELGIPVDVPSRLYAASGFAAALALDAPECLTRIRNKFEHPTAKNREYLVTVDGTTRLQVAQYGLELFELCVLAMMNYRGKYARRAFQGWKGDDEVLVPWA